MLIEGGWDYFALEEPFVKYFRRCKEIGMSFKEIEEQLPYIEKYYQKMVLDNLSLENVWGIREKGLKGFYEYWKRNDN